MYCFNVYSVLLRVLHPNVTEAKYMWQIDRSLAQKLFGLFYYKLKRIT